MPKKSKKRIGFFSLYGWGRGMCYVTKMYADMLISEYDIFILQIDDKPIGDEFKNEKFNISQAPNGFDITDKDFAKWITDNKLDAVVFNEYKQWGQETTNLVKTTKDLGVKAYGYLIWERYKAGQTNFYDRLLAPTVSMERFYRRQKVRNFIYMPYSLDLENEFPATMDVKKSEKFTFFHPGGWGGVHNRKNTNAVLQAFNMLDNENTKLIITSQRELNPELKTKLDVFKGEVEIIDKDLSRQEFIKYYYKSDVIVLPSKWETIGIPILESLAAGKPVITTDAPPMNEFIRTGLNGYIATGEMRAYDGISVNGIDVDVTSLKNQMESSMNEFFYPLTAKNARGVAESIYDIKKNKDYFLDFLSEELQ